MFDLLNPPKNFMKSSHYPILEIRTMKLHEVKKLTEATDRGHLDLVPHCISNAQRMAQHRLNIE